jgi:hypothetical protein
MADRRGILEVAKDDRFLAFTAASLHAAEGVANDTAANHDPANVSARGKRSSSPANADLASPPNTVPTARG